MDGTFRGQQRQGILAVCRAFGPDQVCTTGHARRPQPFFCFDTGDWSVEPWLWRRAGCGCLSPAPTALDSGERRVHENVLDRVLKKKGGMASLSSTRQHILRLKRLPSREQTGGLHVIHDTPDDVAVHAHQRPRARSHKKKGGRNSTVCVCVCFFH